MDKIRMMLMKHKKVFIGFIVLGVVGLICFGLSFVNVDFCFPAFYISAFLAICAVGAALWLAFHKFTKKVSVWWYIVASNTVVTIYCMYRIFYDILVNTGWFQGLEALVLVVLMIPVLVTVYVVCTVFILKDRIRKSI